MGASSSNRRYTIRLPIFTRADNSFRTREETTGRYIRPLQLSALRSFRRRFAIRGEMIRFDLISNAREYSGVV